MPDPIAVAPHISEQTHPATPAAQEAQSDAPVIKDRAYFARQIRLRWSKARESILEVGRLIVEARKTLIPEEYSKFRKVDLPFDYSVLQKLSTLAESARINDPKNKNLLPHSWNTLYEIMQLPDEAFEAGVKDGVINENCQWKNIKALRERFAPKEKGRQGNPAKKRKLNSGKPEPTRPEAGGQPTKSEGHLPDSVFETSTAPTQEEVAPPDTLPRPATEPTQTKAPAKGRITITLSREVADKNQKAVAVITRLIEGVVKPFDFMESVITVEVV